MLNKENIYINLQGKSEEELTDLYNFLESVGEKVFRNDIEWFLKYSNLERDYAHLSYRHDFDNWGNLKTHNKQEVTIKKLKEILQPMDNKEFDTLLTYAKSVEFKVSDLTTYINKVISLSYYGQLEGDEPEDKAHFFVLKYKYNNLTLEQQLEKAKAEVKRLEDEIEDSKIKIGDWVVSSLNNCIFKFGKEHSEGTVNKFDFFKKITDKELINKLNNLIK